VASALVEGLVAPLRALRATVGIGTPDTAAALTIVRHALADVAAATARSWQATRWTGEAAGAAAQFTEETVAAIEALAERARHLGDTTSAAAAAVVRARERLQAIIDDFEARAVALERHLDEPGTADELIAESRCALAEAGDVVDALRAELGAHQAAVGQPAPSTPSSTPAGGFGFGAALGSSSPVGAADAVLSAHYAARPLPDPDMFGSGAGVQLPDGSMATAPNAIAASAVRHALTQLGVPYDWGGTTPGVGLDCSGLTQWAYHEAGLDLPRLAQEQDIGAAIDQTSLLPGDLAVWDGHVAMVVGDGVMIEAGDPVHLSPIRTTNAGQGFQGFWRPTA
jgi:cell wall-associated NlpC family hydrolase